MSQRPEYRAWKESESRMIYWEELLTLEVKGILALSDILSGVYLKAVMQYIGLKDIQGKKMFAQDLCTYKEEPDTIFEVIYEEGAYRKRYVDWEGSEKPVMTKFEIDSMDIVIIGNIYENPELLTGGASDSLKQRAADWIAGGGGR